jgi:glyoxylase-like metal-dependent hydrolase (beta-lactamase superfamily II)
LIASVLTLNNDQVGVRPIRLGFVNAFLLRGAGKHVFIDAGTKGQLPAIPDRLEREGVGLRDIGLIVVTHAHTDHAGSLADFAEATGAKVVVHRQEAEQVRGVVPDILVDDALYLGPYGVAGKVIWTPGHTRGSLSVVLESGEAVVGDLVLPRFMAFGPPAIAFWAASREDSVASIRRVLSLKPSIIHTSHGGPYRTEAVARLVR